MVKGVVGWDLESDARLTFLVFPLWRPALVSTSFGWRRSSGALRHLSNTEGPGVVPLPSASGSQDSFSVPLVGPPV